MYRLQAGIPHADNHPFSPHTIFSVTEAGHFRLVTQADYHMVRSQGRNDYQLLYVADGCAYFIIGGQHIRANAGDFIIYSPHTPQHYHYHLSENPDIYWVHFVGQFSERILNDLHLLTNRVLSAQTSNSITRIWFRMIRELTLKQPGHELFVVSQLTEILTRLTRLMAPPNTTELRSQQIIMDAIEYISNELSKPLTVQELSRLLGVSVSWLNVKFKAYTGMPPMQYIITQKIAHAEHLLYTTDYPIAEIAQICGYDDPLYFSRLFHRHTKMSPREYRKTSAQEHSRI